jgi:hypothetical protein
MKVHEERKIKVGSLFDEKKKSVLLVGEWRVPYCVTERTFFHSLLLLWGEELRAAVFSSRVA